MVARPDATKLKVTCFGILLAVNTSVICIWVPARLQISQRYIDINKIWDRVEKVIFAIVDITLNFYFIYIVKKNLISNGLAKHNLLFRVNLVLVGVTLAMDVG
ncbi:hypothetical protein B0T10DRAFT_566114 [Thelonectria olida]|uniref:Uncharacterized protein n=1 Tax=Thelonectria olida TaxID=1576542 RepID=A0A9P9AH18_9HYPO|nr:hypothetical protein B0T10DRAFT_566114 [Thelonectria olida]